MISPKNSNHQPVNFCLQMTKHAVGEADSNAFENINTERIKISKINIDM